MNGIQHITITHDFFFVTVAWHGLVLDELHQAGVCCTDALDLIGSLGALHLCDLDQTVKTRRFLLQEQLLPSLIFVYLRNKSQNLVVPRTTEPIAVIKRSHALTLLCPNYN